VSVSDRIAEQRLVAWALRETASRLSQIENATTLDELRVIYEVSGELSERAKVRRKSRLRRLLENVLG
jgi:hypothetical protein